MTLAQMSALAYLTIAAAGWALLTVILFSSRSLWIAEKPSFGYKFATFLCYAALLVTIAILCAYGLIAYTVFWR